VDVSPKSPGIGWGAAAAADKVWVTNFNSRIG